MSQSRAIVAIDYFADLSCPWCYVGWESLKRAASDKRDTIAVSLSWRTFLLSPDAPAEGVDRKAHLSARYAPAQLKAANDALMSAAREVDAPLDLNAATRIPNTENAHRLVHWAAEQGLAEAVIDAVFHAYFAAGRDIGAMNVLLDCAAEAGLDRDDIAARLESDEDRVEIFELHEAAAKIGVAGVPVAIFNRKIPLMGAQPHEIYANALEAAAL